uniref:hypothetical protein n=1 Tax=uncultured Sphingomonas sp. TaxID=158754 RepID=UPI0025D763DC
VRHNFTEGLRRMVARVAALLPTAQAEARQAAAMASASWVFTPSLSGGTRAVDVGEEPELRPGVQTLVDTGQLQARDARTEGVEMGFAKGRFWGRASTTGSWWTGLASSSAQSSRGGTPRPPTS